MAVVTMYRGAEVATVDSTYTATYEAFLVNGWTLTKDEAPEVIPEAAPEAPEAAETAPEEAPPAPEPAKPTAPKGRKAR
jgi:hypothetical protein